MNIENQIAQALLKIGVFQYRPDEPFIFNTGISSPLYMDNRQILFHPNVWHQVIDAFKKVIKEENIEFDVIGGLETTGMNFSTSLGYDMKKPTIFVRKGLRDYGTKNRIESGDVKGKKVLLVQDTITTGKSMIEVAELLREAGATVTDCLIVDSQDFLEAERAFEKAEVNIHVLTNCRIVVKEALKAGMINEEDSKIIESWYADPQNWGK